MAQYRAISASNASNGGSDLLSCPSAYVTKKSCEVQSYIVTHPGDLDQRRDVTHSTDTLNIVCSWVCTSHHCGMYDAAHFIS